MVICINSMYICILSNFNLINSNIQLLINLTKLVYENVPINRLVI